MSLEDVDRLWHEHKTAPFPVATRGQEHDGIDVVMLDADIAGCIASFVANQGKLDDQVARILRDLLPVAEGMSLTLEDAEGREYFGRLATLARLVLGEKAHARC